MKFRFFNELLYILNVSSAATLTSVGTGNFQFIKRIHFVLLLSPHLKRLYCWRNKDKHPLIAAEIVNNLLIYNSLYSTYISKKWSLKDKMGVIESHYCATNEFARFLYVQQNCYINLIQLDAAHGDVRIVVDSPHWMRVEGEVTLSLFYNDIRLQWLTFSIGLVDENYVFIVGALQGWAGKLGDERESIKKINVELSKKLHQLHPRIFLFYCMKMIARSIHVHEIWGVSKENHRTKVWHNFFSRNQLKSYNTFWEDHGGSINHEGFYVISSDKSYKSIDDVPTKKRLLYKKKYQLLDAVEQQLDRNIRENNYQTKNH